MRSIEIINVFCKYLIFHKLNKNKDKNLGKRLKEACEELGFTFIKLGQILSSRYDVLQLEDCKELEKLLDNVKSMEYKWVEKVFLMDFNRTPQELFKKFDKIPIASASVSQVHKAKLFTGEEVAVKIKRPNLKKQIKEDIKVLKNLAKFIQLFSSRLRTLDTVRIVNHMEQWLLNDINFIREAKLIEEIKEYYRFCDEEYNPDAKYCAQFTKPYYELSSNNIITMDFIEGIPLTKIDEIKNKPEYDILKSIKAYVCSANKLLFNPEKEFYFQADPHPANIIIKPYGKASSIDCGLFFKLNKEESKSLKNIIIAIYTKNRKKLLLEIKTMTNSKYVLKNKKLNKEVSKYLSKTQNNNIGFWFVELAHILVNNKIKVPDFFIAYGRCLIVLDGLIEKSLPGKTTLDILEEEFIEGIRKETIHNIKSINYDLILYNISEKLKNTPSSINNIINKYHDKIIKEI